MNARAAVQFLGVDDRGMGSIPLGSLDPVKNRILDLMVKAHPLVIDGTRSKPVLKRADFVTLSAAGVINRPQPVIESLDNGIIGISLVYETPELADEVILDWRLFSPLVTRVEANVIDPFGGAAMELTPQIASMQWQSRLSGYQVPAIGDVKIDQARLPLLSLLVFILAFVLFVSKRGRDSKWKRPLVTGMLLLGILAYPFLRPSLDIHLLSRKKPSTDRAVDILSGLLTNVYRSFDVRSEEKVYDRLAISVTGDQLRDIYLENRQSMELENRGGARANVDEVKIQEVSRIKKSGSGSYAAETVWNVSGSVSHFGHTHYRRNYYHANIQFTIVEDTWKIQEIELIEEKRLL